MSLRTGIVFLLLMALGACVYYVARPLSAPRPGGERLPITSRTVVPLGLNSMSRTPAGELLANHDRAAPGPPLSGFDSTVDVLGGDFLANDDRHSPIGLFGLYRPMPVHPEALGMTEEAAEALFKGGYLDRGVVYHGGLGNHRIYYQLDATTQTWLEISGPPSRVLQVGPREWKRPWVRHSGDSIVVE